LQHNKICIRIKISSIKYNTKEVTKLFIYGDANKMIKNLLSIAATFFVAINVMAGGDDRDEGPVESLDEVIEVIEPVTDKVVVGELEAQTMTLTNTNAEDEILAQQLAEFEEGLARESALADFQAKLAEEKAAAAESNAAYHAKLAREKALADFQAKLAEEKAAAAASNAAYQARLAEETRLAREKALADFQAKLAEEKAAAAASNAAYQARLAEETRLATVIGETSSGVEITVAAHEICEKTLGLTKYNLDKFTKSLATGTLYNEGPQLEHGTLFSPSRWDQYFDCVTEIANR
jgi:hypothetical protein